MATQAETFRDEKAEKAEIIQKFRRHTNDCGSAEVQIALLTKRLELLGDHFKRNPNDLHSQRGMYGIITRRKRLLQYLRGCDLSRYRELIASLGLRK